MQPSLHHCHNSLVLNLADWTIGWQVAGEVAGVVQPLFYCITVSYGIRWQVSGVLVEAYRSLIEAVSYMQIVYSKNG